MHKHGNYILFLFVYICIDTYLPHFALKHPGDVYHKILRTSKLYYDALGTLWKRNRVSGNHFQLVVSPEEGSFLQIIWIQPLKRLGGHCDVTVLEH